MQKRKGDKGKKSQETCTGIALFTSLTAAELIGVRHARWNFQQHAGKTAPDSQ